MADATNRRRAKLGGLSWSLTLSVALVSALGSSWAQSILPTQGVVASGAASIGQSGANMTVNQTSSRAILNWSSFSIGQGDSVTFIQPNAFSAVLNRVTGTATSAIAGQLDANGQVYLVNPNGIAITRSGAVRVGGGFVASTLAITDSDFSSGNLNFTGNGASAAVSNAGSVAAAPGGFVGLLGGSVANSGTISVPLGKVGLGSGERATLNLTGDNFLQVAVPTGATTADGQALVDVSGQVRAAGGVVAIKAATAANAIRNAVNVPGELSVSSARASGGSIILDGGAGGNVAVTGRIRASGQTAGGAISIAGRNVALAKAKIAARSKAGTGGSVAITAANGLTLAATTVDASGATGGGTLAIGGDSHGAGPLANAAITSVDAASVLRADALVSGSGGSVTVWSNTLTSFAGQISARGGPQGGDGGSAEVSAKAATKGVLSYGGLADLTAPGGAKGTLLLDPYDITIWTGANSGGAFSGGVWTPTATSFINNATLEMQLALSNVTVSTGLSGSPGADAGNITVSAPVSWSSNNGLTLTAANIIFLNAPISSTGAGQLTLNANNGVEIGSAISTSTGAITFAGPTNVFANVTTNGGNITFDNAVTLSADATVDSGGGATTFVSTVDGDHTLSVTGGVVNFDAKVGSVTPLAGLDVTGMANLFGGVTTTNGPITFNNAVTLERDVALNSGAAATAFRGTVDSGDCACNFAATAGALSFGGALGGIHPLGSAGLVSINGMTLPSITAANIGALSDASLTLAPGTVLTASGPGTAVILVAGLGFINASGSGAIKLTGPAITPPVPGAAPILPNWLIYSANPADDVFGGLNSNNTAVWNTRFSGTPAATGDRYVFAFQPTITVTSRDLTKFYGQDVTSLVAIDYTISGLQPGVAGAYLGDAASAVYSGAPSVTSLGSPAIAPITGSPYPITVGLGGLVIGDGYGFAANSTGTLTVTAPFDPGFVPGLTQINNPAGGGYDVGGYGELLPDFVVACNEPPSLPDPNRFSDPDAALRAISQSVENYFRRCKNPTQSTISDALDEYAAKLQVLAPRLPKALRNIPTIVAEGARRARAARSRTEAVAVLRQTIVAVHKEIALVRSEDPETRSRAIRDGDVVAGALEGATVALVNSGGL